LEALERQQSAQISPEMPARAVLAGRVIIHRKISHIPKKVFPFLQSPEKLTPLIQRNSFWFRNFSQDLT